MSDSKKKPSFHINIQPASPPGQANRVPIIRPPSLKSPRTARFAEDTAVHSPIERTQQPFNEPVSTTNHYMAQPQPSDVGFGYVNRSRHESVEMPDTDNNEYPITTTVLKAPPKGPLKSPLKSAMKTPGAPPRDFGAVLSPTFKEEQFLEKTEDYTEKIQAKDLVSSPCSTSHNCACADFE